MVREGVPEFLEQVSQQCNLFVNTKGREEYARAIFTALDPDGKYHLSTNFRSVTHTEFETVGQNLHK